MENRMDKQTKIAVALFTGDIADTVKYSMDFLDKVKLDPGMSTQAMEYVDLLLGCMRSINKSVYIMSDVVNGECENGYYNVNQFMEAVCENLKNYLSDIYDFQIVFEPNPEFDTNFAFDSKRLEKVIYDIAHSLILFRDKGRRLTFYLKGTRQSIEIGVKTNFAFKPSGRALVSARLMYPDVALCIEGESYASLTVKQMGGLIKSKYLKNMARIEITLPKIEEISLKCMRESETAISNGEAVMVHRVMPRKEMRDFFADIERQKNNGEAVEI